MKNLLLFLIAAFFILFGILHFQHAPTMAKIMPGFIPFKVTLVQITGALELVFAVGLLLPRWRTITGLWLSVYLLAVLPANINMAIYNMPFGEADVSSVTLWVRVFLQFPFIALILWLTGGWSAWRAKGVKAFLPQRTTGI